MSKYFTENFVHGDEAILSEKWPFSPLILPSSSPRPMKKHGTGGEIPYFCARFLLKFCPFSRFCKHAKFSKVNAKFSKGVDFFSHRSRFFLPKSSQWTDSQLFSSTSKNRRFFVQKLFSWRILEIWRPKMAILSILFKKKPCKSVSRDGLPLTGGGEGYRQIGQLLYHYLFVCQ